MEGIKSLHRKSCGKLKCLSKHYSVILTTYFSKVFSRKYIKNGVIKKQDILSIRQMRYSIKKKINFYN